MLDEGLRFSEPVPPGGYVWWYLDGVSEDGRHAVTVIVFIGSVFSPYYAWAGKRDPLNHVAVNVALYGNPPRWTMTERGRKHARQQETSFFVASSGIERTAEGFRIVVDDRCAPIPRKISGEILITAPALMGEGFAIDAAKQHFWRPLAPATPVELRMNAPDLRWKGTGYVDMNWGNVPLESTFSHWDWMRADLGGGHSAIFYETEELDGSGMRLALSCAPDGSVEEVEPPARHALPRTLWRVKRSGWSDGNGPLVRRTLEDTPFYVRTELDAEIFGARRTAIQESLSLRRFKNLIVRLMLPFRMPRLP